MSGLGYVLLDILLICSPILDSFDVMSNDEDSIVFDVFVSAEAPGKETFDWLVDLMVEVSIKFDPNSRLF